MTSLGSTFGRGAMTNHWNDLANSDCLLVIGCNPAENHPVGFRWIAKAQEKGAKLIVVDPRFTRSASKADLYVRLRPGTDIALIGGLIRHVMQKKLYHREYLIHYTNAGAVVAPEFGFSEGLFTGYRKGDQAYAYDTWGYELDGAGRPLTDPTLSHPRCVFRLMEAFYARYTPEAVAAVTGVDREQFVRMADGFAATGVPGKAGTILYAMGATQHTIGVQIVRSYAILRLLLGNIGLPGGGINALRGENNVQGSTDMALLCDLLPGYMAAPDEARHPTLKDYLEKETPKAGYWTNKPKFFISLLKAFWGESAKPGNDFAYHYLPKAGRGYRNQGYSWIPMFEAMHRGSIRGLMVWGMNPAVSSPDLNQAYAALEKLEWLAVFDLWETDTARFWQRPGAMTSDIRTEVFLFPAADSLEKEGSVTNSGRWLQWRYKAVEPRGDAKSDLWYLNRLGLELQRLYSTDPHAVFPDPIVDLDWGYGDEPDVHRVAREINGYVVADKSQAANFTALRDDGSTACGNWLYSGSYPGPDRADNLMARRERKDPGGLGLHPDWSWSWPLNRRILYNRCSMDPQGRPWNKDKALLAWDPVGRVWARHDVPDFGWMNPAGQEQIPPEVSAGNPFIMLPEGKSRIFVQGGVCREGPFPEHYEPLECPYPNSMSSQQSNPLVKMRESELKRMARLSDPRYPVIATTFRVTEHWQAGAMTRNLPWQAELVPEMFVEISRSLAGARGIKPGDWVRVISARGEVSARAYVTRRVAPFTCGRPGSGRTVEMVALPWHFGFAGLVTGGPFPGRNYAANQLAPMVGDANTLIPEYKVFLVDVRKL